MKCVLCDRCKKIIEDPQKCRVITCARPLHPRMPGKEKTPYRGDDRQMNDIIWEKDLCTDCAAELEAFCASSTGSADNGTGGAETKAG